MKNLSSLNRSKALSGWVLLSFFVLMFILNSFTLYCCDDFEYKYSFATGEKISSFKDIAISMAAHAYTMNGRLFAHGLVQIFDALPKVIFNTINSAMFVLLIFLIYNISKNNSSSIILLIYNFCMIWMFTPAFGQVFLWLDGSINYLWGAVFSLLFLLVYIKAFLYDKYIKETVLKILFICYAFFVGGYLENSAVATIVCSVLLLSLCVFYKKHKIHLEYCLALVMLIAGMLFMITRPGEAYKGAASIDRYYLNLEYILNICKQLFVPFLSYVCLNIIVMFSGLKENGDRALVAFILFIGSVSANFVMIFSRVYPERCALIVAVLLILSTAYLLDEALRTGYKALILCAVSSLVVVCSYTGIYGCKDILRTYEIMNKNEIILTEVRGTEETVMIPVVHPETKYSAADGLVYLNENNASEWPNVFVAKYFEIGGVIGVNDPDREAEILYEKVFGQ